MNRMLFSAAIAAALGLGAAGAFGQANEDDVAAAMKKYPLAAHAGEDSHAIDKAPSGARQQGKFDDKSWKFGHAWDAPAGAKIWNPVKLKMMKGEKVTGGTLFAATDPEIYCAMANAGYDFIWTEHQHGRPRLADHPAHVGRLPLRQGGAGGAGGLYPTSARNSTRWMPARWCWWCRRCGPMKKPSRHATGPIFRRWAGVPRAAARPSRCMPACRAAIAPPSMTIWCWS